MIAIDLAGVLMIVGYMAVRIGIPVLAMCLLCMVIPRLFPQQTA